jgi:Fe-S cluster biogenesis protein NfuA
LLIGTVENAADANAKAVRNTVLSPRFYTTDFDAMDKLNIESVRAEWDIMMKEYEGDNNHDHFQRDAAFADEVRTTDGIKTIVAANSIDLLQGSILDYSAAQGLIIRNPNKPLAASVEGLVRNDELSANIETVLAGEVNPALASHGGFVTFMGHDTEGTAYLTMGGGCHGCSMSRMTMLEGVQTTLLEKVPGVLKVRDLTDHTSGDNPYYT